ncbi:MAG: hypothetical protein U0263_38825 [Polyangiaceae bacterium]
MRLDRMYPDQAFLLGPVSAEALATTARARAGGTRRNRAARTVFPAVHIKAGKPDRVHRFEVLKDGPGAKLVVKDITPPPITPGLSDEERWKKAGLTPQGKPLDPKKLE